MSFSNSKFVASAEYKPSFGKAPMQNDAAERIRAQTAANLQARANQRLAVLESQLVEERMGRKNDLATYEADLKAVTATMDALLDFIAHNLGDIPTELADFIAERTEQRMLTANKPSDDPLAASSSGLIGSPVDGQILKRTATGWTFSKP